MNKRYPLDEAFRQKLRNWEAEAPMHLWEQISQKRNWKHRMLNRARQQKPLAGVFAALLVVALCWGVWPYQERELGNFPIPLDAGATAAAVSGQSAKAPSRAENDIRRPENSSAALLPSPAGAVALAAKNTAVRQADELFTAALGSARATEGEKAFAVAGPAVRPVREKSPPALPVPIEQSPGRGHSVFDGLFAPEPRCATFGDGSWSFYVDALLSPDLAFRRLQPRDPEFEEYANSRKETESNMYAFSGALRLSMVSDRGLAARTGLNYSQINERFTYVNGSEEIIETINNYDQEGNIISTDTIVKIGTRRKITQNQYRMLDIPFLLGYEQNFNKLSISINGGAYLNLLFRQKGDFLSPQDLQPVRFDSGDPDAYPAFKQQVGLGWYGSVGFAYQAGPNLQLIVEPHFKIFPKSVTREQYGVQQRYMTTGLFIGVRQML